MSYNYKNEYIKWYAWKENEEKILKELGVSQSQIDELRRYDYDQFKAERRYKTKHLLFDENFFINRAINDILDNIESEALYEYLINTDKTILDIILLKIQGYSVKEISQITGLTTHQIYKKIKKIKKQTIVI